jgi:hypothetical protein
VKPVGAVRLSLVPCELKTAREYVAKWHRHLPKCNAHKVSLAAADDSGAIRAVCIVGRPKAKAQQDGLTLEVVRLASDGCPGACSFLYARASRVVQALGYRRLITYTLPSESGASLRAVGAGGPVETGEARGWSRPGRERADEGPKCSKRRWTLFDTREAE